MKVAGSLGFTALCFLSLFIGESRCANTSDTVAVNASLPNEIPELSLRNEDEDDFVPYQGERFSVFDWSLFRAMGKKFPGNLLISPISIKLALVLLYEGAQDQTAQELAGVLQLPVSRSATRDKFSTILQSLQAPSPSYTLNIGTRLYVDSNVLVRQRYEAIVKTFYDTDLITANLTESHAVAEGINSWVSNITDGNIEKMIEDESSVKDSVMLVLNALFFKGSWRRKYFSQDDTRAGQFYTGTNESVNVQFMHTMSRLYYSESSELDAKILRIPYDGQKFAMYLVLPSSVNGVDDLMNNINPFVLTRHVWLMQDITVDVSIPKFKFDFSARLETILRQLGIRDIFDDTATLTGIARTRRTSRHLKVTDILQKTGIEINENGTVAYAATEVQVGNKIEGEIFHANRPFIFYIEDESTGTILYMGKVMNPLDTAGSTEIPIQDFPTRFKEEAPTAGDTLSK